MIAQTIAEKRNISGLQNHFYRLQVTKDHHIVVILHEKDSFTRKKRSTRERFFFGMSRSLGSIGRGFKLRGGSFFIFGRKCFPNCRFLPFLCLFAPTVQSSFLVDWLVDFAVGGPLLRQRIQLLLISGVHIQDHCVYLLV